MVYRPPHIKQLDGSRYAGLNCTMASLAMAIVRHQKGINPPGTAMWYPKPWDLRAKTGDTSGGTNLAQAEAVAKKAYGVDLDVQQGISWGTFRTNIKKGRGAILQGSYYKWQGTVYDGSRAGFNGNHAVYVNEVRYNTSKSRYEYLVYDPLWDGRRSNIHKGPMWVPESWLKVFAGYLNLSNTGTRRLGVGKAYAAFTRDTEPDVVLRAGAVAVARVTYYARYNGAIVRYGPWTSSSVVAKLAKGAPFVVYQRYDKGTLVDGSRIWFGDATGKRWIAKWNVGKG